MNQPRILQLQNAIAPYRNEIVQHPLYTQLKNINDVRKFTETHVFAVWDFMSLLKGLQQKLTCTQTPWLPVGSANTRYLINEIVLGEESDVDAEGNRCSHFELYLTAMQELGADTEAINRLLHYLKSGLSVPDALKKTGVSQSVEQFVNYTFYIVNAMPVHVQAAVFTFGREDLIPDMFHAMVRDLNEQFKGKLNLLLYYLERHIEVDGDHHSHLAMEMVSELCGENDLKWQEATNAAIKALQKRKALWDSILERISAESVRN